MGTQVALSNRDKDRTLALQSLCVRETTRASTPRYHFEVRTTTCILKSSRRRELPRFAYRSPNGTLLCVVRVVTEVECLQDGYGDTLVSHSAVLANKTSVTISWTIKTGATQHRHKRTWERRTNNLKPSRFRQSALRRTLSRKMKKKHRMLIDDESAPFAKNENNAYLSVSSQTNSTRKKWPRQPT